MRNRSITLFATACAWVTGLLALPFLPAQTPIHWNSAGQADGFGGPLQAALMLPAILTGLALLTPLLPRLDPRGANYPAFSGTYQLIMNAISVFMLLIHLLVLGTGLGLNINTTRAVLSATGLLFALIGNELGRVQPNFFVGIRTPWTIANPEVWRRTHRVGGRMFVALGLAFVLGGLLLPTESIFWLVMLGIASVSLGSMGYSYWVWRRVAG